MTPKSALQPFALVLGLAMASQSTLAARPAPEKIGPPLTVVHEFGDDFHLVGIGVSKRGRVFATAPTARSRGGLSMVEVDTKTGEVKPYPDAAWNALRPDADGNPEWGLVQALWDDTADHLWALDTGIARGPAPIPPKLVEFDLKTNHPIRTYTFEDSVTIKNALNDVRVDLEHGAAYLTAAGERGGIVVLDLKTGHSRLVLAGDRSAVADPKQHLMIGDQEALTSNGSPVVIQTDGIAISPDAHWLYYRPLTDANYWRVPTASLRDSPARPGRALQKGAVPRHRGKERRTDHGQDRHAIRGGYRARDRGRAHAEAGAARLTRVRCGAGSARLGGRLRDRRRRPLHQRLPFERSRVQKRPAALRPVHDLSGKITAGSIVVDLLSVRLSLFRSRVATGALKQTAKTCRTNSPTL